MNADVFLRITADATRAGRKAAEECVPEPMIVVGMGKQYHVPEGMCGFAWINIRPGTSSFARWLREKGIARRDSYLGGVTIRVSKFGQSWERKDAYSRAYARVINEHSEQLKVTAIPGSRLD